MKADGNFSQPTSTQFSTFCGCSSDGTTSTDPTPTLVTAATSTPVAPTASSSTADVSGTFTAAETFHILSSVWPEVEGCYVQNGFLNEGQLVYSIEGTADFGNPWMFAYTPDDTKPSNVGILR